MGIYNTLDDSMNRISTIGIVIIIFAVLLALVLYIAQALFLNQFNKYTRGKSTWQAWVPIANLYLLGDLTFNNIVGWILVILSFVKPESLNTLYNFVIIGFYIYAIVKYVMLKKEEQQSSIPKMVTAASSLNIKSQVKKPEIKEKEETDNDSNGSFKDKLKHFTIKKQKKESEQPQEYQSQQPMSAPTEGNKSNFDFTSQPKQNYNNSSDSLQSLYNRK